MQNYINCNSVKSLIEIIICIAVANCGWSLFIAETPISCNGISVDGCTYYDMKAIYLSEWNQCIFLHEVNEHALKKNNIIHHGICQ